jgi:hypothetical protein
MGRVHISVGLRWDLEQRRRPANSSSDFTRFRAVQESRLGAADRTAFERELKPPRTLQRVALGTACAGTGLQDAAQILEPMTTDFVNFVRQGAIVALGMVFVQQSEPSSPFHPSPQLTSYTPRSSLTNMNIRWLVFAALGQGFIDAESQYHHQSAEPGGE